MKPAELQHTAEILKVVASTKNRLYTYLQLHQGQTPKHISQDLDVTRATIQPYINDWKEHDLIYTEGNQYRFTDKGELTVNKLTSVHASLQNEGNNTNEIPECSDTISESPNDQDRPEVPLRMSKPSHDMRKQEKILADFYEESVDEYVFSAPGHDINLLLSKEHELIADSSVEFEPGDQLPVIVTQFIDDEHVSVKPDIERLKELQKEEPGYQLLKSAN